jgi:hypothetical protein
MDFLWHPVNFCRIEICMERSPEASGSGHLPPPGNRAGRWYLGCIGLSIALLGGLFVWLMGNSYLRAREMRKWPVVPCVILSSELEEKRHDRNSPVEFRHNFVFGYEWQGQRLTGDHLSLRGNPWTSKPDVIKERLAEYPVGKKTTCLVDPSNHQFAVLKPDSLAPGYSIWFPSLFVIGGLGIAFRAAFPPAQRTKT